MSQLLATVGLINMVSNKTNFETWLTRVNNMNRIFKQPTYYTITPAAKVELERKLENELSPENLSCDGELRGPALRAKAALLTGALAYLQSNF